MNKKQQIGFLIIAVAKTSGVDDSTKARAIGTMLYDVPFTKSGYISASCLTETGHRPAYSKMVAEHFHSRNEAGYKLLELVREGKEIWNYLDECSTVHYTTKKENMDLCRIQNDPIGKTLTWQQQYRLAGIKLVKDPGLAPRCIKKDTV